MLKNAYLLAKIGADTAENEQHFAEGRGQAGLPRNHEEASRRAGSAAGVSLRTLEGRAGRPQVHGMGIFLAAVSVQSDLRRRTSTARST